MPENFTWPAPQLIAPATMPATGWAVRILHVEEGSLFGALRVEAPRRFRYITLTLEYVYRGAGQTEFYPDTVALVCIGSSPLQGLSQPPLLFFNEDTGEVLSDCPTIRGSGIPMPDRDTVGCVSDRVLRRALRLNEEPIAILVDAGLPQCATFVYEFHHDCREFRLYFPGCEGIEVDLKGF